MWRYEVLCYLLFVSVTSRAASNHFFRDDYEYNAKTRAYYKLHLETASWYRAVINCVDEDARLMTPSTQADKSQVHGMLKKYPDIGYYVHVGNDGLIHDSVEEIPIIDLNPRDVDDDIYNDEVGFYPPKQCDVMSRDGDIKKERCWTSRPFVCKVEERNLTYNEQCDTYVTGYKYYSQVGSCYKASHDIRTWTEAADECKHQGAHLVVVNSVAEHEVLKTVLQEAPSLSNSMNHIYILAGISAKEPSREFRTIFNQTLEEAGYSTWNEGEPNNEAGEYCGSLGKFNGFYNDIPCRGRFGYICEKEINTQ